MSGRSLKTLAASTSSAFNSYYLLWRAYLFDFLRLIGVAEYRLLHDLPESLTDSLPTVEQLERELPEERHIKKLQTSARDSSKPRQGRKKKGEEG